MSDTKLEKKILLVERKLRADFEAELDAVSARLADVEEILRKAIPSDAASGEAKNPSAKDHKDVSANMRALSMEMLAGTPEKVPRDLHPVSSLEETAEVQMSEPSLAAPPPRSPTWTFAITGPGASQSPEPVSPNGFRPEKDKEEARTMGPPAAKNSRRSARTSRGFAKQSGYVVDGRSKRAVDVEEPVPFLESFWSLIYVVGSTGATFTEIGVACLLWLMSTGVQLAFVYIIVSPSFTGSPFRDELENSRRFRASIAHDSTFVNLEQVSLVARLCHGDSSLVQATRQATILSDINKFLGIPLNSASSTGPPDSVEPGVLLSMLCILYWTTYMCKEIRRIFVLSEATLQLPRSDRTIITDSNIEAISNSRVLAIVLTVIIRVIVSVFLLIAGVQWLGNTTSIQELVLNAVGLGAILDIDGIMFAAMMPKHLQIKIQDLEALRVDYSGKRNRLEALLLFSFTSATVIFTYFTLVHELSAHMHEVKANYCSGNLDFVVSYNAEQQIVHGFNTASYTSSQEQESTAVTRAVQNLKTWDNSYAWMHVNGQSGFDNAMKGTMEDLSYGNHGATTCQEYDYLKDDVGWDKTFRPIFRNIATSLGIPEADKCSDLVEHCDGLLNNGLRYVCSRTCDCANLHGNRFLRTTENGCWPGCVLEFTEASNARPCDDIESGEGWAAFWKTYADIMALYGVESFRITNVTETFLDEGCQALQRSQMDPISFHNFCFAEHSFYLPLAYICPRSCGCLSDPTSSACPQLCEIGNETS